MEFHRVTGSHQEALKHSDYRVVALGWRLFRRVCMHDEQRVALMSSSQYSSMFGDVYAAASPVSVGQVKEPLVIHSALMSLQTLARFKDSIDWLVFLND